MRKDLIEGIDKKQQELNKLCEDLELPLYQVNGEGGSAGWVSECGEYWEWVWVGG